MPVKKSVFPLLSFSFERIYLSHLSLGGSQQADSSALHKEVKQMETASLAPSICVDTSTYADYQCSINRTAQFLDHIEAFMTQEETRMCSISEVKNHLFMHSSEVLVPLLGAIRPHSALFPSA